VTASLLAGPYSLSGNGIQAIGQPASLTVSVTTFPLTSTKGAGNPPNYYHVALLTPGDAAGWYSPIPVVENPQRIPLPPGCTQLGYACINGAQLSVSEVAATVPNWQKQPWDRNSLTKLLAFTGGVAGGTVQTTAFTYTVPANRLFLASKASCELTRSSGPTMVGAVAALITWQNITLSWAVLQNTALGPQNADDLHGGNFLAHAGEVLTGTYQNGDTGGFVWTQLVLAGIEFDA
jgi:hypothetical protein